jgi:signal transduction histidine kinase/CheY-like chemotaxis protein
MKEEAKKIDKIIIINAKLVSFIDELQLERGLSGSFLESKKILFINKVYEQIESTNNSYKRLLKSFNGSKSETTLDLKEYLHTFYKELQLVRDEAKQGHISSTELISFYAINIEFFLDFIYLSSDETSNIKLSRMILSYSKFLFAKEKNGLERVLVTNLIIKKKLTLIDKLKLNNLIVLREQNLNYFLKLLDNEQLKNKYEKNSYLNNQLKIKVIEKTFLKSFNLPSISPERWFDLMTTWINTQDQFSRDFSNEITLESNKLRDKVVDEMVLLISSSTLLLICFLIFISYLYKGISRELDNIIAGISSLSKEDISNYKKISINSTNELSKIASKFNEMVEELTLRDDKTNKITKDLKTSKKELEKSSKLKSEFLANMSHEIRTPLNAIVGFINILKEDENDLQKKEYFNIINSSSETLLEMINDILDFSKIENSQVIFDSSEINILDNLYNITDLFTVKLQDKNIRLHLDFDKDLPDKIIIDGLKLKQILTNLLSNAIKFTKSKQNIYFKVHYYDNKLHFSVKDEGIGVSIKKQKIIFEPFLQADSTTTRKYGGTGLGLTISKRFVDAFGGNLEIKSEENKGSEFYFSIPVVISNNISEIKSDKKDLKTTLNGRILLVEDNKANQMFMKVLLKKMNLTFDIANDGLEAIIKFQEDHYDIILMDENMPNMSGIEATKRILEIEKENNLKHTPIIALTANALIGDRVRFIDAGMDEYLTKPVNYKEFHRVLEVFLEDKN